MNFFSTLVYKILSFLIRTVLRLNGGIVIKGIENIPSDNGAIIAANHISYIDPPLIGAIVPKPAVFMARKGLFTIPVIGWIVNQFAIPVDRESPKPSTIKEAVKRLKSKNLLVIFPEGRRSETGKILEAKRGTGMIAHLSKAPVIPAYISGTEKALPVNAKFLKRAKITVIFGKPLHFSENLSGYEQHEKHEMIGNSIMAAIRDIKTGLEISTPEQNI